VAARCDESDTAMTPPLFPGCGAGEKRLSFPLMNRTATWPNRSYVIAAWLAVAAALALLAIDFILLLLQVRLFAVWLTIYFAYVGL